MTDSQSRSQRLILPGATREHIRLLDRAGISNLGELRQADPFVLQGRFGSAPAEVNVPTPGLVDRWIRLARASNLPGDIGLGDEP